ncbi:WD40-repeat-containing domain protein [Abortiporus biennis]|nr:WD40-repeat-containing domain protein [Abortiporus biennis]
MAASLGKSTDLSNPPQHPPQPQPLDLSKRLRKTPKKVSPRKEPVEVAPIAGSSKAHDAAPWSWKSLTQSSPSRIPVLFTKDGSYFFSAAASSVKIYSVATGHVVSTLSSNETNASVAPRNGDAITCMILNPSNPFQLITGSVDGFIRIWDFLDAILLRIFDVGQPIFHLAAHEKFKDEVYVAVTKPSKKANHQDEDNGVVLRLLLKPTPSTAKARIQRSSDVSAVGKTRAPTGLALSPSGTWLVAIAGRKAYVAATSDLKAGFTKFVSPEKLTCLAFHPHEEYFATGDDKGVIRLWYCLNDRLPSKSTDTEKKAPTTTLHWHAHAVSSVAFTSNGAYLLSGGEEAVLVIWQLHTGKKEFVPRVGAPITTVAISNAKESDEEYVLGLADASYIFVRSATLKISRTIARIKLDPSVSNARPSSPPSVPLSVHSATSTLILPSSHASSLQIFAPSSSQLLSELEVSPSNRVSRREEKPLEPSRVDRAVISESGEWMVTIDSREDDEISQTEIYMKIWFWDRKTASWILNTRIDRPHGLRKVTSVAFRPGQHSKNDGQITTTGEDGVIKVWRIRSTKSKTGESEDYWTARSTLRFRSEIPVHSSWSFDGSIFAVAFGAYIVLYDPNNGVPIQTLTCPEMTRVSSVHFVGRSGRYLVSTSTHDLVLWDLLSQSVRWSYRTSSEISKTVCHPREDVFIVFETPPSNDSASPLTKVLTFTPSSALPSQTRTLPFSTLAVVPCPTTWTSTKNSSSFALVAITGAWNVVLLGDDIEIPADEGSDAKGIRGISLAPKRTLFQDIFGASAFNNDPSLQSQNVVADKPLSSWKGKEVEQIFDTPAYILPPIDTLFDTIMDNFLVIKRNSSEKGKDEVDGEDEDVDMDVEDTGNGGEIVVGNRERTVGPEEFSDMVELFKQHAIRCEYPPCHNLLFDCMANVDDRHHS